MASLVWTRPALEDLQQIQEYIARDSRIYAQRTARRIRDAARRLRSFPDSGRRLPEFPEEPFREVIVAPYRIIYRHLAERDAVSIDAVIHGRRSLLRPPDVG